MLDHRVLVSHHTDTLFPHLPGSRFIHFNKQQFKAQDLSVCCLFLQKKKIVLHTCIPLDDFVCRDPLFVNSVLVEYLSPPSKRNGLFTSRLD